MRRNVEIKKFITFKFFTAILLVLLIFCGVFSIMEIKSSEVHANSAQRYWEGYAASGVINKGGECPLVVEKENLTFKLVDFAYALDSKNLSTVTAEYSFYNPSDIEVKANLVFPYVTDSDYFSTDYSFEGKILIDGKETEFKNRYTYSRAYDFSTDEVKKVRDYYDESGFFKRGLPVTRYYFTVSELEEKQDYSSYAKITLSNEGGQKYAVNKGSGGYRYSDSHISVGAFVKLGDVIEVEVYGGNGNELKVSDWEFYENGGEKKKIIGEMSLKKKEETTFEDIVFKNYNSESGVSKIDWYNAVVDMMNEGYIKNYLGNLNADNTFVKQLMSWYEYDLTVPAKGRVVNSVTAPVYPSVDSGYSPWVYGVTYLFSPAKTWKSFGSITVNIETPYYLIGDDEKWEKADNGYTRVYQTLPDEELSFSVSQSESPELVTSDWGKYWSKELILSIVFFALTGLLVFLVSSVIPLTVIIIIVVVNNKRVKKTSTDKIGANLNEGSPTPTACDLNNVVENKSAVDEDERKNQTSVSTCEKDSNEDCSEIREDKAEGETDLFDE